MMRWISSDLVIGSLEIHRSPSDKAGYSASRNVLAEAVHDPADVVYAKHGILEHESPSSPNETRADWPDIMTSSRTDSSQRRSVPDMV